MLFMMFIIRDVTVSSILRHHGDKSPERRHGHMTILNDLRFVRGKKCSTFQPRDSFNQLLIEQKVADAKFIKLRMLKRASDLIHQERRKNDGQTINQSADTAGVTPY